jgi:hypothetical protein
VYVVTLPPLPPPPAKALETTISQSVRGKQDKEFEDELSRQYWDAYALARTSHSVTADEQPGNSSRAAYVQVDPIDYTAIAKIDADFREPPPVILANGVVLKAAPKLRRYPAGTRQPPALAAGVSVPSSASASVAPYTWDGISWASHRKDATIVMCVSSIPPIIFRFNSVSYFLQVHSTLTPSRLCPPSRDRRRPARSLDGDRVAVGY